jgi:hypothetical protein
MLADRLFGVIDAAVSVPGMDECLVVVLLCNE